MGRNTLLFDSAWLVLHTGGIQNTLFPCRLQWTSVHAGTEYGKHAGRGPISCWPSS